MIANEENMIKKGSQTSTSFSSEIDEDQKFQLNVRAKMELIDK
jgi:palmitoyltransferase